jgi:hypothetical protein
MTHPYPKNFDKACGVCKEHFLGTFGQKFCSEECSGFVVCKKCGRKINKRTGKQYNDGQTCRKCFYGIDQLDAMEKWRAQFPTARNFEFRKGYLAYAEVKCPICEGFNMRGLAAIKRNFGKRGRNWPPETCAWCAKVLRPHPEWSPEDLRNLIEKHRASAENLGLSIHEVISILLVSATRVNVPSAQKREIERQGYRPRNLSVFELPVIPRFCPVFSWIRLTPGRILNFRRVNQNRGDRGKHFSKDPTVLSLDRIIPSSGYVADNVEWLSVRANICKRDSTFEELVALGEHGRRYLAF